jgi:hypothetical protein
LNPLLYKNGVSSVWGRQGGEHPHRSDNYSCQNEYTYKCVLIIREIMFVQLHAVV